MVGAVRLVQMRVGEVWVEVEEEWGVGVGVGVVILRRGTGWDLRDWGGQEGMVER